MLNTEGGGLGAEQPEEVYHPEINSTYKPTTPESEPVEMEDEGPPRTLTLSATGGAKLWWCLGDYTLTEEQHRGRPVYKNSEDAYLYTLESGAWGVSLTVGFSAPRYRSTTAAPSPALCQNWEYRGYFDIGKYYPGDINVVDISNPGKSQ